LEALPAVFPESGSHRFRRSKWYQREHLKIGAEIRGPALIAEYSATTVVPPKWRARVDGFGCLSLSPVDSK
jgi:N-methylhydantoinase A